MQDILQMFLSLRVLDTYDVNSLYHTVWMIDDRMNKRARNSDVMEMITEKTEVLG